MPETRRRRTSRKAITGLDPGVTRSDRVVAASMAMILLVTLTVWILFKDGFAKYILYTIPVTFILAIAIAKGGRIQLHRPGVVALLLFLACALTSMAVNSAYGFFAIRDLTIVAGYVLLFGLAIRLPSMAADLALVALIVGMIAEAAMDGIGEEINLFGSEGILESTLAFPIGAVTLYYLYTKQWGRSLIAGVWLFLAFKRITFMAVPMAVGFDLVLGWLGWQTKARRLALLAVLTLSLISLFSVQIFEYVATALQVRNTSANSISLGRYELAQRLWWNLANRSPLGWLVGDGPSAADAVVMAHSNLNNPHNDWLKITYDYGAFGFVAIHAMLYRIFSEHRLGLMLYIYTAVVMMTDNIFIYMFYHPFLMLLMAAARRDNAGAVLEAAKPKQSPPRTMAARSRRPLPRRRSWRQALRAAGS